MIRSFFDMGFRPSLQVLGSPRMGFSLKEMDTWWKEHYPEFQAATGALKAGPPGQPMPVRPPPAAGGGGTSWLLIGGAAALGIGVVVAIVASQAK